MNTFKRLATKEPEACCICRRHAFGTAYAPNPRNLEKVFWCCNNPDCLAASRELFPLSMERLNAYENRAAMEAGDAAGAYLDELDVTDLAALAPEQYHEFIKRVIFGFEKSLRRIVRNREAPF